MERNQTTSGSLSREEFFNDYWTAIADQGWHAVVLHSWKDLPEKIVSDIDYGIAGVSAPELLQFLAEFCNARGWRLAQLIEHEPGAFFCTCVQRGGDFEILALDVTWDYRRLGHLLIPSALLQENSRSIAGKSFQVPSPGAEASYILAKAAAKGKDFADIKPRLHELAAEDPDDFDRILRRAFPDYQPSSNHDADSIATIERWFNNAPSLRAVRSGHRYGIREIQLYLRRILHPTGIRLSWQLNPRDEALMESAVRPILPLFRRVVRCYRVSPVRLPEILSMIIRTSLILERDAEARCKDSSWRISVVAGDPSDAAEITCQILDRLAARVTRRISNQRP